MAKKARKKAGGRGGRGGASKGLASVSTAALHAELERRQAGLDQMEAEYEARLADLRSLGAQIEALGGTVAAPKARRGKAGRVAPTSGRKKAGARKGARKRPRNAMSLEQALAATLQGKAMGVTEVAEAVLKNGYKTSADNFRTIVNQTLIKSPLFKKLERGVYTAK